MHKYIYVLTNEWNRSSENYSWNENVFNNRVLKGVSIYSRHFVQPLRVQCSFATLMGYNLLCVYSIETPCRNYINDFVYIATASFCYRVFVAKSNISVGCICLRIMSRRTRPVQSRHYVTTSLSPLSTNNFSYLGRTFLCDLNITKGIQSVQHSKLKNSVL